MAITAIVVGALVGGGTAAAMGGDFWEGAAYGAVGGGIGGSIAAAAPTSLTRLGGSMIGGAAGSAAGPTMTGLLTPPGLRMPAPTKLVPRPTISTEIARVTAGLGERLKKVRSRFASRVTLPGQITEMPLIQRPMLSDILG